MVTCANTFSTPQKIHAHIHFLLHKRYMLTYIFHCAKIHARIHFLLRKRYMRTYIFHCAKIHAHIHFLLRKRYMLTYIFYCGKDTCSHTYSTGVKYSYTYITAFFMLIPTFIHTITARYVTLTSLRNSNGTLDLSQNLRHGFSFFKSRRRRRT